MSVPISEALTLYAVGSAVTHTVQALRWLYKAGQTERSHYIAAHVQDAHGQRLRYCQIGDCHLLAN